MNFEIRTGAFENADSPFTEILTLIKQNKELPNGLMLLAGQSDELKIINLHVTNAIEILLHGMQDLGHLIGVAKNKNKYLLGELNNIGFFIAAISNLTEALNTFRSDTDFYFKK